MSSFFNSSSENSKFNNYLSVCDLVNKYNLKSANESPKLSQVIFEFSSFDILSACENSSRKELDSDLQIKTFFLLYMLECQRPFVNLNKIKITKVNGINYSVKVILSSKDEMDSFLKTLFIENWSLLLADDFRLMKSSFAKYNKYIQENKKFILNTKISGAVFFELDSFLSQKAFGLNSKNLNLGVSFVFENKTRSNKKMCLNLVKNLPFFWVVDTKQ